MKVTWVCKECSSNNSCERADEMFCFVCGAKHTDEPLHSPGMGMIAAPETELAPANRQGFFARVLAFFSSFWKNLSAPMDGSAAPKIVDWQIERGPDTEKEAYLTASAILADAPPSRDALSGESVGGGVSAERRVRASGGGPTCCEPWPEHRLRFVSDKLGASGCVKVERSEFNGAKGYFLTYDSGKTRFMTVANMKLMGYMTNR